MIKIKFFLTLSLIPLFNYLIISFIISCIPIFVKRSRVLNLPKKAVSQNVRPLKLFVLLLADSNERACVGFCNTNCFSDGYLVEYFFSVDEVITNTKERCYLNNTAFLNVGYRDSRHKVVAVFIRVNILVVAYNRRIYLC